MTVRIGDTVETGGGVTGVVIGVHADMAWVLRDPNQRVEGPLTYRQSSLTVTQHADVVQRFNVEIRIPGRHRESLYWGPWRAHQIGSALHESRLHDEGTEYLVTEIT